MGNSPYHKSRANKGVNAGTWMHEAVATGLVISSSSATPPGPSSSGSDKGFPGTQ